MKIFINFSFFIIFQNISIIIEVLKIIYYCLVNFWKYLRRRIIVIFIPSILFDRSGNLEDYDIFDYGFFIL